ncbi:MAG: oligosaccharide flippase family protein [Promethearchaeota archaeon]
MTDAVTWMEKSVSQKVLFGTKMTTIWLLASHLVGLTRGLLLIRLLSVFEYGVLAITLITLTIANLMANFRIDRTVTKFVAEGIALNQPYELKKLFYSSLFIKFILSAVIWSVILIFSDFIGLYIYKKPSVINPIRLVSLGILPTALFNSLLATFHGIQDFKVRTELGILKEIIDLILSVTLVILGYGVMGVVISYIISVSSIAFIGFTILSRRMSIIECSAWTSINLEIIRKIISFSGWLMLSAALSGIYDQVNSIVISIVMIEEDIAMFRVALTISGVLGIMSDPIYQALIPIQSELYAKNDLEFLKNTYRESFKFVAIIMMPVVAFCIIFASPILLITAGSPYASLADIFRILLIKRVLLGIGIGLTPTLLAINRPDGIAKFQFIGTLTSIIASITLIPTYGLIGGAISELISIIALLSAGVYLIFRISMRRITPPLISLFKISLNTFCSFGLMYLVTFLKLGILLTVSISIIVGFFAFLLAEALLKTLDKENIMMLTTLYKTNSFLRPLMPILKILIYLRNILGNSNS